MNVSIEETGVDSVRLRPSGYIDLDTVRHLRRLAERLTLTPRSTLVLDLAGVEFMDSAGLTFLVWLRRTVDASGATLEVADVQPAVGKVLRLTGIDVFLSITGDGPPAQRDPSIAS